MRNYKNVFVIGILIVLLAILFIIISFVYNNLINQNKSEDGINTINIYYYDKINNRLVPEKINIYTGEEEFIENLLDAMKFPSKTSNYSSMIPNKLSILDYNIENKNLEINFSKEYNDLESTKEIFFRSAFVWSVTEVPFIENVKIMVEGEEIKKGDGKEIGYLNRSNVILNHNISPDKIETEQVILYFSDKQELFLIPEKRNIEVKQSKSIENQIVEQLIEGPKLEGYYNTIPQETKIRNIKTEDGICYVDLSNEFISKHSGGTSSEIFTIYSIVNSLTELDNVNKVQFLIEGKKIEAYKGNFGISKPLDRNEDIIYNNFLQESNINYLE